MQLPFISNNILWHRSWRCVPCLFLSWSPLIGLPQGALLGIITGCLFAALLILLFVYVRYKKHKHEPLLIVSRPEEDPINDETFSYSWQESDWGGYYGDHARWQLTQTSYHCTDVRSTKYTSVTMTMARHNIHLQHTHGRITENSLLQ